MKHYDSKNAVSKDRRLSYWTWPGPANLYEMLLVAIAWFLISYLWGKSQFVMALATALTICGTLAWNLFRGNLEKWTQYIAWVFRIAAVITGVWLFVATPTLPGRIAAVILYTVLYIVCERAVWRSAHAQRNTNLSPGHNPVT